MSDILSQAEIEALLNSLGDEGELNPAPAPIEIAKPSRTAAPVGHTKSAHKGSSVAFEIYDFRRPDKFSKDQLRTLQMLHETFARLAGSSLSAYLRAPVSIDLISLEQ
ncbi:MAG TPA: hypothetical protein VEX38_06170, partial [Fimbriimonadaceae bacterium]|nr:hypothetical protein [Fimbriimonadaceae bacterium]